MAQIKIQVKYLRIHKQVEGSKKLCWVIPAHYGDEQARLILMVVLAQPKKAQGLAQLGQAPSV